MQLNVFNLIWDTFNLVDVVTNILLRIFYTFLYNITSPFYIFLYIKISPKCTNNLIFHSPGSASTGTNKFD